jgi:apolipoprotein N-acyltransferase
LRTATTVRHLLAGAPFKGRFSRHILDIPFGMPAASGVLLILIQPPLSLGFLAVAAIIPLLYSLTGKRPMQGFTIGLITGIVSYTGLVYWTIVAMNKYGGIGLFFSFLALLLLVLYLSLYTAFFGLAVVFLKQRLAVPFYLSAPVIWMLLEYLRGIAISGFPWSLLAHSQYNFLPAIQVAAITGTYFISYLLVAVNAVLFELLWLMMEHRKRTSRQAPGNVPEGTQWGFRVYTVVLFVTVLVVLAYGISMLGSEEKGSKTATLVQGNVRQDLKWDESFKIRTIKTYYNSTESLDRTSGLIIWPETALPLIFNEEDDIRRIVGYLPSRFDGWLLFGTITRDKGGRLYNSAYALGPKGEERLYHKVHLVPFGEYTPFRNSLPFFENISVANGEFFSGPGHTPLETGAGRLGILICYEGIFPEITRETVRQGAQVLVNLTNDAWYDYTSAPFQHLAFYVFRAVETDRYVLRCANTGISALIDPRGRIVKRTPLFREALLPCAYELRDSQTVYVRQGDVVIVLGLIALLLICGVQALRKRLSGAPLEGKQTGSKRVSV